MEAVAKFLSILLIPLLIPVYLSGIVMCYFPQLSNIFSVHVKWIVVLVVFVFTVLLPFTAVFLLYKFKVISSLDLYKRKDRYIPQLFSCFSYGTAMAYFIYRLGWANVFSLALIANTISAIAITIITHFWKISTHSSGAIGLLAILSMICLKYPGRGLVVPYLVVFVLCVGVCFARKILNAHTTGQIIAGGLLGLVIGVGVFWFLK